MATVTFIYTMRLSESADGKLIWDYNVPQKSEKGPQTLTDKDQTSTAFTSQEQLYFLKVTAAGVVEYSEGGIYLGSIGNAIVYFAKEVYFIVANNAEDIPASGTLQASAFPVCFLAGTRIATPTGEAAVEDLAIGALVLTTDGRPAPVRWVGVQRVVKMFADPLRAFPIRIMAGALGQGLPVRDLCVSPDHALLLEGLLVQAGALVNGTTIVRETAMPERFTYFHVELDDHALILAEGVPAETFVDNVTRQRFDNYAEYEALYGEAAASIAELDLPRVKSARQLPQALRERLAGEAAAA